MSALAQDLDRPTRWPALDGWRGVAVLIVVGYHGLRLVLEAHDLIRADVTPPVLWFMGIGKFSVDAFFVLSGFLITVAWRRRPEPGHFYRRRIRRVVPVYLVSVVVLAPLLAPEVLLSPRDLGLLLTMQGYLEPGLTASVNVPWWSLTTEVHFYLLVPLLVPVIAHRVGRWAVLGATAALSAWWWSSGHYAAGMAASLLPGRLTQFVAGALVAVLLDERREATSPLREAARRPLTWRLPLVGLVALGLYLGAHGTYHRREVGFDAWIEPLSALLLAVALCHLVVRSDDGDRPLCGSSARGAGLTSYSLYLWHYPVLVAAVSWLDVETTPAMAVPALAAGFGVSALIAWCSYRWIERPLLYGRAAGDVTPEPAPGPRREAAPVR